jgi:hypothetical protein
MATTVPAPDAGALATTKSSSATTAHCHPASDKHGRDRTLALIGIGTWENRRSDGAG